MTYDSFSRTASQSAAGVFFVVCKPSFARRVQLTREIRELANRVDFLDASRDSKDKLEAALVSAEIDRIYVSWGVKEIIGLEIDGCAATVDSLIDAGPEPLFREAVDAVKAQLGLSEAERKN